MIFLFHNNPYSAGIDFRRQILTSKIDPHTVKVKIFIMAVDPYHIGIQMKQKELTKNIYNDIKLKKTRWSPWLL